MLEINKLLQRGRISRRQFREIMAASDDSGAAMIATVAAMAAPPASPAVTVSAPAEPPALKQKSRSRPRRTPSGSADIVDIDLEFTWNRTRRALFPEFGLQKQYS
jgi:hypothetical protein